MFFAVCEIFIVASPFGCKIVPIMKTVNHIVHLRLKEKPLPNSMSSRSLAAPADFCVRQIINTDTAMKRYLPYLIATVFIICVWFLLGWLTYPRIKNQLTKRNIYLLLLLLGLVI